MTEHTGSERASDGDTIAAAALDRGKEQLEGAKAELAEGAERVAAAVDRTADGLEGEGDDALSGFGHSIASLMRQLAGGLRERDVEQFARELGDLARRNPGVFLAGSVALGFGVARFFKARAPAARSVEQWQEPGARRSSEPPRGAWEELDSEERLDLSANATRRRRNDGGWDPPQAASSDDSEQAEQAGQVAQSADELKGRQS